MVVEPFESWWCCLNPRERNTLSALVPLWFVNPTYVGRATFDAIAALTGESSSIKMLESFMLTYSLRYELIPCGEDCFIDAVVWTDEFWALLYVFAQTGAFICSKPCTYLTFPE